MEQNFRLPKMLKAADPELFKNYLQNITVLNRMLNRSLESLSVSEDYSATHSLDMVEACGNILSEEAYAVLSPQEIFILLMSCYLYEIGWTANRKTIDAFLVNKGTGICQEEDTIPDFIRHHHRELSGFMIRKNRELFDFPSDDITECIAEICEYPPEALADENRQFLPSSPANADMHNRYELAVIIYFSSEITRMIGFNQKVTLAMMKKRSISEITEYIQRNATIGVVYEEKEIILYFQGSNTVYELIRKQTDILSEKMTRLSSTLKRITVNKNHVRTQNITYNYRSDVHVNHEIEYYWTEKDWDCFKSFSEKEKDLYIQYLVVEYHVTGFLEKFVREKGLSLMALNFRVKSPASVYGKIYIRKLPFTLDTLNDVLRYTIILPEDSYVTTAEELLEDLKELGLLVCSVRNTWLEKDIPYNGLNVKLQNREGYRVEIQFHTEASYRISKSKEDHELYEKKRLLDPSSPEYRQIEEMQFALYSMMNIPRNIASFRIQISD